MSGVQDYWQQIITGVILIVVVLIDRIQRGGLSSLGIRLPFSLGSSRTPAEPAPDAGPPGPETPTA